MNEIIVYDSGIGGIPVLLAMQEKFPQETYLYFSDPRHMPYGNKSEAELLEIAREIVTSFSTFSPKAVMIACNTMSELVLSRFQAAFSFPIFGVKQQVEKVLSQTAARRALLLCTARTAEKIAERLPRPVFPQLRIVASSFLAAEIEKTGGDFTDKDVKKWTGSLRLKEIDVLFLGCTHYIWMKENLRRLYPHLRLEDGVDFLLEEVSQSLHLESKELFLRKRSPLPQLNLKETPEHVAMVEQGNGDAKEYSSTSFAKTASVHFVGEGLLKNQNAYLFFRKQMFGN